MIGRSRRYFCRSENSTCAENHNLLRRIDTCEASNPLIPGVLQFVYKAQYRGACSYSVYLVNIRKLASFSCGRNATVEASLPDTKLIRHKHPYHPLLSCVEIQRGCSIMYLELGSDGFKAQGTVRIKLKVNCMRLSRPLSTSNIRPFTLPLHYERQPDSNPDDTKQGHPSSKYL